MTHNYTKAISHHQKVMATASHALRKFLKDPHSFMNVEICEGSSGLTRCGKRRQVEYVEINDGSGITLRIEVFTKKSEDS